MVFVRRQNVGGIVGAVFLFISFGMVVRGGIMVASLDDDSTQTSRALAIGFLAGGSVLFVAGVVVFSVAMYKYQNKRTGGVVTTGQGGATVTIVNPSYNTQYHGNRNNRYQGNRTGYQQNTTTRHYTQHLQPMGRPPGANQNPPYSVTNQNPPGYQPMQNAYPPPNQNPAYMNPALAPGPPSYSSLSAYPPPPNPSNGATYGGNYSNAPSAPPPTYDAVTTDHFKQ